MNKTISPFYALKLYRPDRVFLNMFSIWVSDYVIVSFQKCGKTWLRVMLSKALELRYGLKNIKLDLQLSTWYRLSVPNILISHAGSTKDNNKIDFRRIFKGKKKIFLVRDPRDIVVSLFHGSRTRDKVYFGDNISDFIRDENSGFSKIISFMNDWAQEIKEDPSILILRYEDLRKDPFDHLKRVLNFLKINLADSEIESIVNYGSFNNMRKLEMSKSINDYRMLPGKEEDPNSFRTRKGKVRGYIEELSERDIDFVDSYLRENLDSLFGYK